MRRIVFLLGAVVSAAAPAQTYKWTDERGGVTYGSKPPAGRTAQRVDAEPRGPVDLSPDRQRQVEADARRRANLAPPPPPPVSPRSAAEPVRGMGFDTYIRLERGMSEGELVQRAGRPDQVALDSSIHGVVKTYYYLPTSTDPFVTVVTVNGGRIANLERTKKF